MRLRHLPSSGTVSDLCPKARPLDSLACVVKTVPSFEPLKAGWSSGQQQGVLLPFCRESGGAELFLRVGLSLLSGHWLLARAASLCWRCLPSVLLSFGHALRGHGQSCQRGARPVPGLSGLETCTGLQGKMGVCRVE